VSKLRFFAIISLSFLLVFVYGCKKGSEETVSDTPKFEQGAQTEEGERGEHERTREGERREHAEESERGEHKGEDERGEHGGEGEHEGEAGEYEGGEEEAGPRIAIDGIHDEVRKGSRLILTFDKESSFFVGTVENISEKTLTRVRIEVHLSNGTELGPTEPVDLKPGEKIEVKLSAEGQSFEWWTAHAEVGISEHR